MQAHREETEQIVAIAEESNQEIIASLEAELRKAKSMIDRYHDLDNLPIMQKVLC